jgi:arylsulfatase A-like enzyme
MNRTRLALGALAAALSLGCQGEQPADTPVAEAVAGPRPNIVVVVVDDLRWDEFGAAGHPFLETPNIDRLASEGALFTNAFHAVSLCSPNRASLLTGQFPTRHGIIDNVARNFASHRLNTFPIALQEDGYNTAFLGKWHMGNDPTPRPGFDYWVALPGQGRSTNPELYEDGRLHTVEGYTTDLLTDRAVDFIERDRDGPFLLYLAHKAVHPDIQQRDDGSVAPGSSMGYVPAPRHRGRYEDKFFERRPNVVASYKDLPENSALRHALEYRASDAVTSKLGSILDPGTSEETIRRRSEMVLAVDEGLGRIMDALEAAGTLDQTLIVLTSDNGFFYGEHGLSLERRLPYEESIRNPFLMRYPPLIEAGSRPEELVLSVDLAPTVLDLAGTPIGDQIQGRSLVPVLAGTADDWRKSILVEFYTYENPMPWLVDMDYRMVRTDRYKYVHWMQHPDQDEMYDLEADPYEMTNIIDRPEMAGERDALREELGQLVLQAMNLGGGS